MCLRCRRCTQTGWPSESRSLGLAEWGEAVGLHPLFCEAEAGADSVADHGERNPGAEEQAITGHEATSMIDGEKGAPELIDCAAVFAETGAGGQVEHPDADDGEENQARDPYVACNFVALHAGDEEAAYHGYEEGEDCGEEFGSGGVSIGAVHRHDAHDETKDGEGKEGVGEEPERLAAQFAD
jgi:hypothetical protein